MKFVLYLLVLGTGLVACNTADKKSSEAVEKNGVAQANDSQVPNSVGNNTSIQWLDSTFLDLGKVKEGKVVEVSFRFRNSGNKPLIISNVTAGCGCTVPEKPEEPFAPGQEGVIRAKFDSKGRPGEARKDVTVTANTDPTQVHTLTFRVEVTN